MITIVKNVECNNLNLFKKNIFKVSVLLLKINHTWYSYLLTKRQVCMYNLFYKQKNKLIIIN